MTTTTAPVASPPVIRSVVERARAKNHNGGVIGIRAAPTWDGPPVLAHEGGDIAIVACPSALAVREALLTRGAHPWLVVLTDRDESDLGVGIRSRLLGHRLHSADPWEAVRRAFAANGIEPALAAGRDHREIAAGLLAHQPAGGWPPARGGLLTVDHAFSCLARVCLDLTAGDPDARAVLAWSTNPAALRRIGDLRSSAGDVLASAVLRWLAGRCGNAAAPLRHVFDGGHVPDAVPLGLAVGVLAAVRDGSITPGDPDAVTRAREALVRLEARTGGFLDPHVAAAWANEAADTAEALLTEPDSEPVAHRCLARADAVLAEARGDGLSTASDLLPSALTTRLADLSDTLRQTLPLGAGAGLSPDALAVIEQRWAPVRAHRLRERDPRTAAFAGAVRLSRWLATPDLGASDLAGAAARHRDADGWVDSAINDAASGVADPGLSAGLEAVLTAARARRSLHDLEFAAALAQWTTADSPDLSRHGLWRLEDVLAGVVIPATRHAGVLFLILDGMSVGVGTEVLDSVISDPHHPWIEALLPGHARRAAGLAVLPTLTEVSRASLLCGQLRVGAQDTEQAGYQERTRADRLVGSLLFHKKPLDSSRLGYAVADDVAVAIADTDRHRLVTCVLNTIDDALDRTDPGGTDWTADTVKHLRPLLDVAQHAGRIVIITADHGHIVERRMGRQQPHPAISSARSRAGDTPAGEGEVWVHGRRVLKHEGAAVLAVDEGLRYGPLKAGYHGGAAPAEVVVPLAVLVPGIVPDGSGLVEAPPQNPGWWITPYAAAPSATARPEPARPLPRGTDDRPTLFDDVESPPPTAPTVDSSPVVAAVLTSAVYAETRAIAGRLSITDDDVQRLLAALLAEPRGRLDAVLAAQALKVPLARLSGAVSQAIKLLNVEGYPVLGWDADGSTLRLDETLLREQFEVEA